jgi:hypothetical protein
MAITFDLISTTTLTGNSDLLISSIPQTYTDLKLIIAADCSAQQEYFMRLNNNAGSYYSQIMTTNGSSLGGAFVSNESSLGVGAGDPNATSRGASHVDLFNYSSTTQKKTGIIRWFYTYTGQESKHNAFTFDTASAITSIKLFTNTGTWTNDAFAWLYGIKAA